MAASYPSSVKSFTTRSNGNIIPPGDRNDVADEVTAIEGAMLSSGFDHWLKSSGVIIGAPVAVTIASGVVSTSSGAIVVDTQGAAASDDLDTINVAAPSHGVALSSGAELIVSPASAARVVTVKDATGNLKLQGDFVMSSIDDRLTLVYDGTNWTEKARTGLFLTKVTGTTGNIANATPSTIFSALTAGRYNVYAYISGAGAANYTAFATVVSEGANARIVADNGVALTLTLSGTNVQTTQTSGGLANVAYGYSRI